MRIEGHLTEADYRSAFYLNERPRSLLASLGIAVVLIGLLAVLMEFYLVVLVVLAYLTVYFLLWLPYTARRNFRRDQALGEYQRVELAEEGLFFRWDESEGLVPWSHFIGWKSGKKIVLLYRAKNEFYLVPRHFFDKDAAFDDFIALLEEKLGRPV